MPSKAGGTPVGSIYGEMWLDDKTFLRDLRNAEKAFKDAVTRMNSAGSAVKLSLKTAMATAAGGGVSRVSASASQPDAAVISAIGFEKQRKIIEAGVATAQAGARREAQAYWDSGQAQIRAAEITGARKQKALSSATAAAIKSSATEDSHYRLYQNHVQAEAAKTARSLAHMGSVARAAGEHNKFLTATVGTVGGAIGRLGQAAAFGGVLAGLGAGLIMLGRNSVDAYKRMDALRRALEAITGSSSAARTEIKELKEAAKLPGLGLEEAIQGAINLQSAGMSAKLAKDSMIAFGNALALVGRGKAYLDDVTLALTKMVSKNKIMGRDLQSLLIAVPQTGKIMREIWGTADTKELAKMGIGATEFITKMTAELGKLPKISDSVLNTFDNLKDAVTKAFDKMGEALGPAISSIAKWLTGLLEDYAENGKLVEWLRGTLKNLAETAKSLGDVALTGLARAYDILTLAFKATVAVCGPLLAAWNLLSPSVKTLAIYVAVLVGLWPKLAAAVTWAFEVIIQKYIALSVETAALSASQTALFVITSLFTGPGGWARLALAAAAVVVGINLISNAAKGASGAMTTQADSTNTASDALERYSKVSREAAKQGLEAEQAKTSGYATTKWQELKAAAQKITNTARKTAGIGNAPHIDTTDAFSLFNRKGIDPLAPGVQKSDLEDELLGVPWYKIYDDEWNAYVVARDKYVAALGKDDSIRKALGQLMTQNTEAAAAAATAAATAIPAMEKTVTDELTGMRKEAYLLGDTTAHAAMLWETSQGKFAESSDAEKTSLLDQASALDKLKAAYKDTASDVKSSAKTMSQSLKDAADDAKDYAKAQEDKWQSFQDWAKNTVSGLRTFASDTVAAVKDQLKQEKDLRDKGLDDAKSRYQKMGELGRNAAMIMSNTTMFAKQPDKEFGPGDMTATNVRSAAEKVRQGMKDQAAMQAYAEQQIGVGGPIAALDAIVNAKDATLIDRLLLKSGLVATLQNIDRTLSKLNPTPASTF